MVIAVLAVCALLVPALPAQAASPATSAFERTWNRTDQPVASGLANRTWMWGPEAFTGPMLEYSTDSPAIGRQVQYFDKSRMEASLDPGVNPYSIWSVTNGLLARELVTGVMQTGDQDFEPRSPAQVNVAGDADDPTGPTYATFQPLLDTPPLAPGTPVTARIDLSGTVTDDPSLAGRGVTAVAHVAETNHTVASPFWDFMNSTGLVAEGGPPRVGAIFPNPFYATGFPITEAYWTNVKVAGVYTDVLVQVFERRVLTYTPGNPEGWQVEAGNVGRHYFEWRYGVSPPATVADPGSGFAPLGPTPLPAVGAGGGDQATVVVANMGPQPLHVTFEGATSAPLILDGCPGCQVLDTAPDACSPDAPRASIALPPGSYSVTVNRPAGGVQPLAGTWTLLPDASYGACFFMVR